MVPNGSTKHTQDTSHLRVGTNSPPPASNLPKPPWFMNTMSKNVTSDSQVTLTLFSCPFPYSTDLNNFFTLNSPFSSSQEEEKNAFSNPKQRSTEQPKEKKKVRTKDKKLQKGTKGSIKQVVVDSPTLRFESSITHSSLPLPGIFTSLPNITLASEISVSFSFSRWTS